MPTLVQLWLPIVLSGVFVFFASSLIHMVLRYHDSDYGRVPDEEAFRALLRKGALAPGQYVFPHCLDPKEVKQPETALKFTQGPVGLMWVKANGFPKMGAVLLQWLLLCLGIAFVVGYLATIVLPRGTSFLTVFRIVSTVAFLAHAGARPADTIWMGKPVSCLIKDVLDAVVYAAVTGATFGWLWPH